MTPRFLRIAEKSVVSDLSIIKDPDGNPFRTKKEREEYITKFYGNLYKNPVNIPNDFTNCVEDFLGDLVNHPTIRSCILTEEEKRRLDADMMVEELDMAMEKCNLQSAPGIDGFNNRFIKKFWPLFRLPLTEYFGTCRQKGTLTATFSTALIKLIPKNKLIPRK